MEKRFNYKLDYRSKRITRAILLAALVIFVGLHFVRDGNYLPAWFIAIAVGLMILYILSIPRFILVNNKSLEIHCVIELTHIAIEQIEQIQRIPSSDFRKLIPLIGSYGFWGYYGYYFNLREWSIYKVYASQRKHLVLIRDIYETNYVVSCSDPDLLVTLATAARDKKRAELYQDSQPL